MSSSLPFIEISLDNLLHNLNAVRSRLPQDTGILAIVKDNAYGCGSVPVAKTLEENGVRLFGVARPDEAFFLRRHGIASDILVIGPASAGAVKKAAEKNILFTLNDLADIHAWKKTGAPVRFHCNIDTRMHRLGILPTEVERLADALAADPLLRFEGAFTHLANADQPGTPTVREQLVKFSQALALLKQRGFDPAQIHYANSAAIMRFDPAPCTLARPGIALYGCKPDPKQEFPLDLRPVASLKSRVMKVKKVPAGTPVSYGGLYVTERETVIATIALGYGQGLPRSLSNRGEVLIRGKRFRIAGRVTMDCIMVDAGPDSAVSAGDEAVAMGVQGGESISPDDVALLDDTIAYEILCGLSGSIDRVYLRNGRVIARAKGIIF